MAGQMLKANLEVLTTVGATYKVPGVKAALAGDTGFPEFQNTIVINDCSNRIRIQFRAIFRVSCQDCLPHSGQVPCFHRLHRRILSMIITEEQNCFNNVRLIMWDLRSEVPLNPSPNTFTSPPEESPMWFSVMEPLEQGWRSREMAVHVADSSQDLAYNSDGALSVSVTVKMSKRPDPFISRMEAINAQNQLALTNTTAKQFIDHLLANVRDLTFVTIDDKEVSTYANMFICHTNFFRIALDAPFLDMMSSRIKVNMTSETLHFFMDWMAYGIVGSINFFEEEEDVFDQSRANIFDLVSFSHMWEMPRLLTTLDYLMVMHVSEFNGWCFREWAELYNLERTLPYAQAFIQSQQHLMAATASEDKLFQNEFDLNSSEFESL